MKISLLCIAISILSFSACMKDVDTNPYQPKNNALGKMNEIVVVSDQTLWDGSVGDTLDFYLGGAYPITPRPEPLFDLRHFTAEKINQQKLLRELRTYLVIADLNDMASITTQMVKEDLGEQKFQKAKTDPSYATSVGKNKWANGQLIIYLFAKSQDAINEQIRDNFESITQRVQAHDRVQLKSRTFAKGENLGLTKKMNADFGLKMEIPSDYVVAKEVTEENFLWLRKDTKEGALSVVVKKLKYQSQDQLTKSYMKDLRDTYGKKYVTSAEPNSFMLTNDVDLPILEYGSNIAGQYGKEFRGIWEIENDFIGGPFISYMFLSENQKDIYFIDTWVFAPGKKKRDSMQELEFLVRNIEG